MQMTEPRQSHAEGQRVHTVCNLKQQTCITYKIKHLSYLRLMGPYVLFCCLEAAEEKGGRTFLQPAASILDACRHSLLELQTEVDSTRNDL